jgi:hypothetical protein
VYCRERRGQESSGKDGPDQLEEMAKQSTVAYVASGSHVQ